jgi:hypothetical protein
MSEVGGTVGGSADCRRCSTRASARWPVSASACAAGNRRVRSPGLKPKRFLFHPGAAGEGKTGGRRCCFPIRHGGQPCGVMGERE